jgi:hypothetical protein
MRLFIALVALLLAPASASAAELTMRVSDQEVQYGAQFRVTGKLTQTGVPLPGQVVELQARKYPFTGPLVRIATTTTALDGTYSFRPKFSRNVRLNAFAPAQRVNTGELPAYVFPRPRSTFKGLPRSRLRITQLLTTPRGVRLTAPSFFYLGPRGASTGRRVARALPHRIARGRFKASAVVRLPRSFRGRFRFASCFLYSRGSGMGNPRARCPRKWRFEG